MEKTRKQRKPAKRHKCHGDTVPECQSARLNSKLLQMVEKEQVDSVNCLDTKVNTFEFNKLPVTVTVTVLRCVKKSLKVFWFKGQILDFGNLRQQEQRRSTPSPAGIQVVSRSHMHQVLSSAAANCGRPGDFPLRCGASGSRKLASGMQLLFYVECSQHCAIMVINTKHKHVLIHHSLA